MGYATRTRRPPRTLTAEEQTRILKVSGEHRDGFRDHVILSLAIGCGLRQSEIVALDVADVTSDGRTPRRTIHLRVFKRGGGVNADPKAQVVRLPDGTFYKLEKYLRSLAPHAEGPLFISRKGNRLSMRRLREMFQIWQEAAGFDHPYSFHHLRHTAITNVQREERDIRLTQKFARHRSINTTLIYEHASDEQLARVTRRLAS